MHGFSHRHTSYPMATRLAKLWVHSHMFSGYLADVRCTHLREPPPPPPFMRVADSTSRHEQEIIELLVAHAYTNPRPFEEPHNHVAGFLRFLHLLSTFNWEETALVVDIDGEFDYDDHQHIQATYERLRSLQVRILFIYISLLRRTASVLTRHLPTSASGQGARHQDQGDGALHLHPVRQIRQAHAVQVLSIWRACVRAVRNADTSLLMGRPPSSARHSPTPLIFKRVVAYAQQSYRILRELVENPFTAEAKWRALFVTPLTPYDVLIHLESAVGAKGGASSKYKNLQLPTKQPVYVGLDLVENYLSELRARFGHLALFFHNALEGRVIGVVWKPGTFAPKPFKVLHTEFAVPVSLLPADSPLVKVRQLSPG
jgi:U3 small nucleolar RNA-associated protein 22